CELSKVDDAAGKVTWKDGFGKGDLEGKLSYWPGGKYTVVVEEKPSKTVEIKQEDIQPIEEENEGKKSTVSGVIRECVYEFKIRPGVKWTDGEAFKIDDILFSFQTTMNPDVLAAAPRSYMADTMNPDPAKACVKLSDDSVRFELKKQYFAALGVFSGIL